MKFESWAFALLFAMTACAASPGRAEPPSAAVTADLARQEGVSMKELAALSSAPFLERSMFVRAVLRANPNIDAARASMQATQARARGAGSFAEPMLEVSLAPLSFGSARARPGYELGITQELPWFGKRGLERDAANAEASAAKQDLERLRRDLALSALSLWDQYFVVERSLPINREHAELVRTVQASALAALAAGRGSAQGSLEADSELARLEHDRTSLLAERDVIRARMNELLHREPDARLGAAPSELTLERSLESARTIAPTALAQRPEILAAREHMRAETARAERANLDRYPNFRVSTSYNSMWDMPEHRWMVGLGFNLPLAFEHRASAAEEARAMRAHYESQVSSLSDAAKTELYVALRRVSESEQVLDLFERRSLPLARAQIEALRAGFTASTSSISTLLEAERELRSMELDYQMARATCDRRLGELERALGQVPGVGKEAER